MTRPRSDPRSGAVPRSEDLAALRRELYRPGADATALDAYLAALPPEPEPEPEAASQVPVPDLAAPAPRRRAARWRIVGVTAIAVAALGVGVAVLPRPATPRPTAPTPSTAPLAVAPARFDGLRGGSTIVVALPFRTNRVRVLLECGGRRAQYGWMALGQEAQTEQFIPVLTHRGANCTPSASYVGPIPGGVSALRILVTVDGPYALTVEPI